MKKIITLIVGVVVILIVGVFLVFYGKVHLNVGDTFAVSSDNIV